MASPVSREEVLGYLVRKAPAWVNPDRTALEGIRVSKDLGWLIEGVLIFRTSRQPWKGKPSFRLTALDVTTGRIEDLPGEFSTQYSSRRFLQDLARAGLKGTVTYRAGSSLEGEEFELKTWLLQ